MEKLLTFLVAFILAACCRAQTTVNLDGGITQYQDRVEDANEIYSSSSYLSKALGFSVRHHLTERLSMEPGILWRSYVSRTSASFSTDNFTVGSISESHSSTNQLFFRLNYDVLKFENLTVSPSIAYHRVFDPQSPGAFLEESLTVDDLTFESSQVFTGKSVYGAFELGIVVREQLSKSISLAGFFRINYLSENQSGIITYSFDNLQEEQALTFRESKYTYVGLALSIQVLKGNF